eukprot:480456-Pyramimonas_sp.AAC.1
MRISIGSAVGFSKGAHTRARSMRLPPRPFLVDLATRIDSQGSGLIRARADDIGGPLSGAQHLREICDVMTMAGRFANLALKIQKCKLAPLPEALGTI